MDVQQIRRFNLLALIKKRFNGNAADLARAIERSDSQVSQLTKNIRNIGEKQARYIERKLDLPRGSLDKPDAADLPLTTAQQPQPTYTVTRIDPGTQSALLSLFEKLTRKQQAEFLAEIEAMARANEVIIREVGGKLCPADDETVARHLPPSPESRKK